jgi:uncharacterized FlaG/YvyC family protein
MKVNDVKSLDKLSDKQILQYILATQLQIIRKLDFLESKISNKSVSPHSEATKEMVSKLDSSVERINKYLSMSDEEKGNLRF